MQWATAGLYRDQLVLFPQRLDDVVPAGHAVRLLDGILGSLDWSAWEAAYKDVDRGRPPFSPRLLASIILYGLLVQIRASRKLEEALFVRLDFRWLAQGRSVDHTTLCEFRRKHADALKDLFVKVGVVAQQTLMTPLCRLAFDGTRIKASNHRGRRLSPEKLKNLERELAGKFADLQKKADAEDAAAQESFDYHPGELSPEMADVERRQQKIQAALAEMERIEQAGEDLPKRIPLTDPESRISPNKEGGFAAIKQHFGVRQFLLRGLDRVRMEWTWITIAFNLKKLMAALEARAGPGPPSTTAACDPPHPLTDPRHRAPGPSGVGGKPPRQLSLPVNPTSPHGRG